MTEPERYSGTSSPMAEDNKVAFHYIKSKYFRVVHADGAFGGLTPHLDIFLSLYSERPPIPKRMVHDVVDGRLGDEIRAERKSKSGIVREAEIGITMDIDVAKSLVEWLQQKIQDVDKVRMQAEQHRHEGPRQK